MDSLNVAVHSMNASKTKLSNNAEPNPLISRVLELVLMTDINP